ncbi:MAG: NUDIX domain-containing protein [Candidatus Methylomirabilis oxygeniifera]|uniref:Bis(5'-nucleosyl)-tetraphosphatase [asymmetrical] n=1 Tax=Methylomirabilis oxygeniifera TaxID=671143 RepID=D5ML33_METO1|nr:MAG: NUDIX domain-containing protein [Candidatus Methylomirabilis oxyfera]CBE69875.1 Bis(5'-nucleosyl)-tetraphosphatase [asymmetrical] (Diadenosine 5',5'''-P1,P4-tetraphosphate asymmetrical hydrolase) (Diadenosine tetraphosphatase) (Ap4A hydrolase) (Ap4Aase) (Nucleoside diphosphate-linked moiety X motif 2) (Nudix motif 2) [Candidatus Methylomirabilis oxyfera]
MAREISAGVILFRRTPEPHYLLLHYESGHWDFPKGHIEPGEDAQQTAMRELKEETGISDLSFVDGYKQSLRYFFRQKGIGIFKLVIYFLAETDWSEVSLSDEHIGFDWLPYDLAMSRLTFKNSQDLLAQAHEHLRAARPSGQGDE